MSDCFQDQRHQLFDHLGLLYFRSHCISVTAAEQIMFWAKQRTWMFAGGGEETGWTLSCLFDRHGRD